MPRRPGFAWGVGDDAMELCVRMRDNGWVVVLFDVQVTRMARSHAVLIPGEKDWIWFDSAAKVLAHLLSVGYSRCAAIGAGDNKALFVAELSFASELGNPPH